MSKNSSFNSSFKEMIMESDFQGTDIVYKGFICPSIVESLGEVLRKKLRYLDTDAPFSEFCFSVYVELITNITMHSVVNNTYVGKTAMSEGLIGVEIDGDICRIYSKNLMKTEYMDDIKEKLDHLNSLDKESLRNLYKEDIKTRKDTDSKGAGLGFIEISKRASEPIKYSFVDCGEGFSHFAVCVTLLKGDIKDE